MSAESTLDLTITATTGREFVPFLRTNIRRAHRILKPPLRELSLALVGDSRMARLHQRFMDLPGPTDVLTFPLEAGPRGRALAGEVVVCVPEARRQARRRRLPVRLEVLLYALHGMLHLSGFDDRTERQFERMHDQEDDILRQLGFGPVFADRPQPSRRTARSRGDGG